MMEYIQEIIVPFVESKREMVGDHAALVIMDNFKGQKTPKISELLEDHNIHMAFIPLNTTDKLQPMDVSVNKPAKDFLKRKFEAWYSNQVMQQLHGVEDIDSFELTPVDLSYGRVKELSATWIVEMVDHLTAHPEIIVNGFIHSGMHHSCTRWCQHL